MATLGTLVVPNNGVSGAAETEPAGTTVVADLGELREAFADVTSQIVYNLLLAWFDENLIEDKVVGSESSSMEVHSTLPPQEVADGVQLSASFDAVKLVDFHEF